MKVLITGTKSGLGKYLSEAIGNTFQYNRDTSNADFEEYKALGVDVIIHCAFNSSKQINSDNLNSYIEDNIFLTKKILKIPHKKFIFISTVDVYPKDGKLHSEKEVIDIDSIKGIYGITKLISESLVETKSLNHLILRCSTLLGKYSRKNSLIKILKDDKPTLTLSKKSVFNYILYSNILDFIKLARKEDLQGIYNIASSKNIILSEIAKLFKKKVNFGNYIYDVGNIDNKKISSILSAFKKNSKKMLDEFIQQN